jgi:hypothetical protein
MKRVLILMVCLPILVSAQTSGTTTDNSTKNFYSKSYDLDYKKQDEVQKIAQNFLSSVCMVGTLQSGVVVSHFSLPYSTTKKGCLSVTVTGDVLIHAWDNKTQIEFVNLRYTLPQDGGSCSKTGELKSLYNCSKCRIDVTDLQNDVDNYTSNISTKYGNYIHKINGPDGYKLYAFDYGPGTHFDEASFYDMKYGKHAKDKKPASKAKK